MTLVESNLALACASHAQLIRTQRRYASIAKAREAAHYLCGTRRELPASTEGFGQSNLVPSACFATI